jgi:hypothetical protein
MPLMATRMMTLGKAGVLVLGIVVLGIPPLKKCGLA